MICCLKPDCQIPDRTAQNKKRREDFGTIVWHSDGLLNLKRECGIMLILYMC